MYTNNYQITSQIIKVNEHVSIVNFLRPCDLTRICLHSDNLQVLPSLLTACSPLESLSSSDDEEVQRITNPSPPKVVLNYEDNNQEHPQETLPPVLRRAKFRQASASPAGSPKVMSPEPSPIASPRSTPRGSPVSSPRGVKKLIKRGKVSDKKYVD